MSPELSTKILSISVDNSLDAMALMGFIGLIKKRSVVISGLKVLIVNEFFQLKMHDRGLLQA